MPFRFFNPPAIHKALMNNGALYFINVFVFGYLDHILFFSNVLNEYRTYVDPSDTGMGAVLSQVSQGNGNLQPCAFFL